MIACPRCGRPMVAGVQSRLVDGGKSPAVNTPVWICSGHAYLDGCEYVIRQDAPRQPRLEDAVARPGTEGRS